MPRSLLPKKYQLLSMSGDSGYSSRELAFELLVTKAILGSLDLDQILYVVLSGITSGDGLEFNRAVLLLSDEGQRWLTTRMAIGPVDKEDAHRIWEAMQAMDLTLEALLLRYDAVRNDRKAHKLTRLLQGMKIDLDALRARSTSEPRSPLLDESGPVNVDDAIVYALQMRTTLHSGDIELVHRASDQARQFRFTDWWIVPLLSSERIVGVLIADSPFTPRKNGADVEALLIGLTNLASIAIEKSLLFEKLRSHANLDGLTGVASRRFYDEKATQLLTEVRQTGHSLSLILVDVDFFKQYNDSHGHIAGDEALRAVARTLKSRARSSDLVARYGGEEFTVLLPNTTLDQARRIAEDLVRAVRDLSTTNTSLFPLTISAGVACTRGQDPTIESVLSRADQALYDAKDNGRNRVHVLESDVKSTPPPSERLSRPPPSSSRAR